MKPELTPASKDPFPGTFAWLGAAVAAQALHVDQPAEDGGCPILIDTSAGSISATSAVCAAACDGLERMAGTDRQAFSR